MFKIYTINSSYIDYLKEFDDKVPDVDYGSKLKLFIGKISMQSNNINLYIPITSYKPKFERMKDSIDFIRMIDATGDIAGAIDINNMIPVPDKAATEFTYEAVRDNPTYESKADKDNYYQFVVNELKWINSREELIKNNAIKVYEMVKSENPNFKNFTKRCCDFVKLFEKAYDYNAILNAEVDELMNNITKQFRISNLNEYLFSDDGKIYVQDNENEFVDDSKSR